MQGIFPMTETLNQWILENITEGLLQRGVKKVAYLYPADYISKLGLEMFISQAFMKTMSEIQRKFFSDVDQAVEWIKSLNHE